MENKPNITLYVADLDVVPSWAIDKVILADGFRHYSAMERYEFLIKVVGISHEYALDNSDMDFECMLDHITDVDLDELAHEPVRMIQLEELTKNEYGRTVTQVAEHRLEYYAPNSLIHVRYIHEL